MTPRRWGVVLVDAPAHVRAAVVRYLDALDIHARQEPGRLVAAYGCSATRDEARSIAAELAAVPPRVFGVVA